QQRIAELCSIPGVRPVTSRLPERVDVYCPCAGGGDIGSGFDIQARAIVGAANNQLTADEVADELHSQGVLYVPDWVVNGGGLISGAAEYLGETRDWVSQQVEEIGNRVADLLARARREGTPPLRIAYGLARQKVGLICNA